MNSKFCIPKLIGMKRLIALPSIGLDSIQFESIYRFEKCHSKHFSRSTLFTSCALIHQVSSCASGHVVTSITLTRAIERIFFFRLDNAFVKPSVTHAMLV